MDSLTINLVRETTELKGLHEEVLLLLLLLTPREMHRVHCWNIDRLFQR